MYRQWQVNKSPINNEAGPACKARAAVLLPTYIKMGTDEANNDGM